MGAESPWHWIIVVVIVLLLFGRGRVSELMGDVARGIKGFKKAMSDEGDAGTALPNSESTGRGVDARTPPDGRPGNPGDALIEQHQPPDSQKFLSGIGGDLLPSGSLLPSRRYGQAGYVPREWNSATDESRETEVYRGMVRRLPI